MIYAAMAQLVERVLGKDEVGGSNPPSSSKKTLENQGSFYYIKMSSLVFERIVSIFKFEKGVYFIGCQ